MKAYRKFCLLTFVSVLLVSATFGASFIIQVTCKQTTSSYLTDTFPQAGKFLTLVGRTFTWEIIDEENVTTEYYEEMNKWSIQDVVGDVTLVNRTYMSTYKRPQTGENYTETYDVDYQIATNRTILSAYWKWMSFDTSGFRESGGRSLDEDVGERTWAWFPMDLDFGTYVLVGWLGDGRFLTDTLYEVVGDETIQILGEKQDCWMLHMPPTVTKDGTQAREETYWVDKDTGVPLKLYTKGWALDDSFGWEAEFVLVNTNIDLGLESTQPPSPTYTLTVPTTPGFPEAGKFWSLYVLDEGWHMNGMTNVTYYEELLLTRWVVQVTDDEALVYKIWWGDYLCDAEGIEELERVEMLCKVYRARITTREILEAISCTYYSVNMTSLTYDGPVDLTDDLADDVGEETYCWLPTNLYIGANVNMTWSFDRSWGLDNATYTVIDETIISALGEPQACWMLYLPPTPSIDGTWNYTDTTFSDKDTGVPLKLCNKGEAVDGNSAYVETANFIDTNVDLGPKTYVFPVVADSQTFYVVVMTNSTVTIDTFIFSQEDMKIGFNVTESSETTGFCNITIPKALLTGSPWTVKINNATITPTITSNDTHTFLYFNYTHSTSLIEIVGTWVIPEFPATMILPLLMTATLVAIIARKKRKSNIISR